MKWENDKDYTIINLRMLFHVLVVIFPEVSIDNDKNIEGLLRIDSVINFIIICIILSWIFKLF